LDIFSYKCELVKCSCPDFCKAKKNVFVISNANILQSTWWIFLKFFLHLFRLAYHKILWLHVSKNVFFQNLVLVLEMSVLEHFWWKHSYSPLGDKREKGKENKHNGRINDQVYLFKKTSLYSSPFLLHFKLTYKSTFFIIGGDQWMLKLTFGHSSWYRYPYWWFFLLFACILVF